jgi:glucose/arabinose dehydrogenase
MRTLLFSLLFLLLAVPARAAVPTGFTETSYSASALNQATGLAWAPDGSGRLFIITKLGQVQVVSLRNGVPETSSGNTLVTRLFATEPNVYTNSECGLIGIAFDPNYAVNRYVYVFVTVSSSEQRIVRYTDANGTGTARTVVIPGLPTVGQNHDGGGIGFGPDGKLYWAVGDLGNGTGVDNDLTSLAAKVGRANLDGTPVNDNPFFDGTTQPNNDYIWARGLRNPFTFTFQPSTGQLWVNGVGDSYEQVFVVSRGAHAGYNDFEANQDLNAARPGYLPPVIKYRTNGWDTRNLTAAPGGAVRRGGVTTFTTSNNHLFRKGEKLTLSGVADTSFNGDFYVASVPSPTTFTVAQAGLPDAASGGGSARTQELGGSITGGTFYDATLFPAEYRGNYFFGDFNSGQLTRATLAADNSVATVDGWGSGMSLVVDVAVGPDGALYAMSYNSGTLRRITPSAPGQKLAVSGLHPRVVEGGRAAFTVRLASAPTSPVTVRVERTDGSPDLSVGSGATLTFSPSNWAVPQAVLLDAAADADSDPDTATFSVTADGLQTESVRATTIDTNAPRLVLSTTQLVIAEGGTATVSVALSQAPSGTVTVNVARTQGDADITVQSASTLTFNGSNWSMPQTISLAAAADADNEDGTAILTVAVPGLDARAVSLTEADDEPLPPVITSTPVTTAVLGNPYRYDVEARARPAPTYALVSSVPGMSIDAQTGLITWTPTTAMTVEVSVRASSGLPPDATQTYSLTAKTDDPPVAILTRPREGERVSGEAAEFFGDCQDDVGCTRAEFHVDGVLQYTDVRTDNHFHFGGEHNRWNTTELSPGGHLVKLVVVDTAGQRAEAQVKVCVGDGGCELAQPDAGTDGGTDPAPDPVQPGNGDVVEGGCGCGAAPVASLAWLALAALALRRGRPRRD